MAMWRKLKDHKELEREIKDDLRYYRTILCTEIENSPEYWYKFKREELDLIQNIENQMKQQNLDMSLKPDTKNTRNVSHNTKH